MSNFKNNNIKNSTIKNSNTFMIKFDKKTDKSIKFE